MPREVLFGAGALAAVGPAARRIGSSALICTDPTIAASSTAAIVRAGLEQAGVRTAEFAGAEPDLPLACVEEALAAAQGRRFDVIIGLGGGSSIDLAKAVALLSVDPGPIERFYGENRLRGPVLPVVAIPTTAGTGSEVTPVAVLSDPGRRLKVGVSDQRLVPEVAIVDPVATLSCPRSVTAFSGVDALTHAVEAWCAPWREQPFSSYPGNVFRGQEELSRHYALAAIERIARSLERACEHGDDLDARSDMAYASLCAGIAFAHAGTASAHALQYPVGAATRTPHGLGVALLLPYTLQIARPAVDEALSSVAAALGIGECEDRAGAAIDEIERLVRAVGVPSSLAEIGVARSELPHFAKDASEIERLVRNSPRPMGVAELLAVLEAAWAGDRVQLSS